MSVAPVEPVEVKWIRPHQRCRAIGGIGFCRRRAFLLIGGEPRCELHAEGQLVSNLNQVLRTVQREEAHA